MGAMTLNIIVLVRLAVLAVLAAGAEHFGTSVLGLFLALLAVVYGITTVRMALKYRP